MESPMVPECLEQTVRSKHEVARQVALKSNEPMEAIAPDSARNKSSVLQLAYGHFTNETTAWHDKTKGMTTVLVRRVRTLVKCC